MGLSVTGLWLGMRFADIIIFTAFARGVFDTDRTPYMKGFCVMLYTQMIFSSINFDTNNIAFLFQWQSLDTVRSDKTAPSEIRIPQ